MYTKFLPNWMKTVGVNHIQKQKDKVIRMPAPLQSLYRAMFGVHVGFLHELTDKVCKELTSVHRAALLKATGCLANSSTEAIEILTNCNPLHLHLKLRQAEELLRIQSKNDKEPIKEEFETSINNQNVKGKKTTINLLISAFTEMKGKFNLENVAKEFQYTKDTMGLCRNTDLQCNWKEFESDKALQEENIKGILDGLDPSCVAAFTDGSALGNPGPTGAGAVIYYNGSLNQYAQMVTIT